MPTEPRISTAMKTPMIAPVYAEFAAEGTERMMGAAGWSARSGFFTAAHLSPSGWPPAHGRRAGSHCGRSRRLRRLCWRWGWSAGNWGRSLRGRTWIRVGWAPAEGLSSRWCRRQERRRSQCRWGWCWNPPASPPKVHPEGTVILGSESGGSDFNFETTLILEQQKLKSDHRWDRTSQQLKRCNKFYQQQRGKNEIWKKKTVLKWDFFIWC